MSTQTRITESWPPVASSRPHTENLKNNTGGKAYNRLIMVFLPRFLSSRGLFQSSSVHRWTAAFLFAVHRLYGAIEGILSHFLPRRLKTGWQSVVSLGKSIEILRNGWELNTGHREDRPRDSFVTELSWLTEAEIPLTFWVWVSHWNIGAFIVDWGIHFDAIYSLDHLKKNDVIRMWPLQCSMICLRANWCSTVVPSDFRVNHMCGWSCLSTMLIWESTGNLFWNPRMLADCTSVLSHGRHCDSVVRALATGAEGSDAQDFS